MNHAYLNIYPFYPTLLLTKSSLLHILKNFSLSQKNNLWLGEKAMSYAFTQRYGVQIPRMRGGGKRSDDKDTSRIADDLWEY